MNSDPNGGPYPKFNTVWIVDDDHAVAETMAEIFTVLGYTVRCTSKLSDAFAGKGDLLVVDQHGVGFSPEALPEGPVVLRCSGDPKTKPDLPKPFGVRSIKRLLQALTPAA